MNSFTCAMSQDNFLTTLLERMGESEVKAKLNVVNVASLRFHGAGVCFAIYNSIFVTLAGIEDH
ncbi:hypothetical protein GQX74_010789 [Glossina fuscipes]|nr:hypothetical protein GQX74_010789 [Glossina fuscipes]